MDAHDFDFEKVVNRLKIDDKPKGDHREDLRLGMLRTFEASKQTAKTDGFSKIGRAIMQSRITKFAAAAVIIIGVIFGMKVFDRTGGVVWADVVEQVRQIRTYTFNHSLKITNTTEQRTTNIHSEMYGSTEYGWRAEMTIGDSEKVTKYISLSDGMVIELLHGMKKYNRGHLSQGQIEEFRRRSEPHTMVEGLLSLEYAELGRSVIEGIEVEGVEITDVKFATGAFDECTARLWVSVETNLPVRIEFEGVSAGGTLRTLTVADGFDWEAVLDESTFEANIPEDYTLFVEVDLSDDNEEKLLGGLRDFAELTGGRYPSVLSIMTASKEISLGLRLNRLVNDVDMNKPPSPKEIKKAVTIQSSCLFYAKLMNDDKDPAYYGDKVTAEFGDAVLLRWKVEEGLYRAVFGDLRIETVSVEDIERLESLPLNRSSGAIKPTPADGTVVSPTQKISLGWMEGMNSVEHKVYFGNDPGALEIIGQTAESVFDRLPELKAGAIYYWRIDEVFEDDSVAEGNVWSFRTGSLIGEWLLNDGHVFDGVEDYVDLGADTVFEITSAITVMCRVKVNVFDKEWQAIVTKGDTSWRLSRDQGDNLHFACTGVWPEWVHGKANVNDGKWHHVAGVYDGESMCIYIDGELDVYMQTVGNMKTNDEPVRIGDNSEKPDRKWNGAIGDVQLYDYALNADEVAAVYSKMEGVYK